MHDGGILKPAADDWLGTAAEHGHCECTLLTTGCSPTWPPGMCTPMCACEYACMSALCVVCACLHVCTCMGVWCVHTHACVYRAWVHTCGCVCVGCAFCVHEGACVCVRVRVRLSEGKALLGVPVPGDHSSECRSQEVEHQWLGLCQARCVHMRECCLHVCSGMCVLCLHAGAHAMSTRGGSVRVCTSVGACVRCVCVARASC